MRVRPVAVVLAWSLVVVSAVSASEPIQLASSPSLSPDGELMAFSWRRNLWIVSSEGGEARQVTTHMARDMKPCFSPDGKQLAFTSERTGTRQVYVISVDGGFATQVTFHSEGSSVEQWYPDGRALLVSGPRDQFWHHPDRFFRIAMARRSAEELLFDASGHDGRLSPDGKKILFAREGVAWWRKGYRGSQASQIWLYDIPSKQFTKIVDHDRGCRSPLWRPDGKGFYYVGGQSGSFNLWERELPGSSPAAGKERQLTHFSDDSVVMPCISRDGSTIVFRHLFDLYRFRPAAGKAPERIEITCESDVVPDPVMRRVLQSASEVSFSRDGLEVAMIAGGDLWVMDTELREPRQITRTPEEERSPAFAPDGRSILFVSDSGGQSDIWRAVRSDSKKYWWQNDRFVLARITNDPECESNLQWSPLGDAVAFVKGLGDLWVMNAEGKNPRRILAHWEAPSYDWSPDGKWITYASYDTDFNRDVWVVSLEGEQKPVNLSCHPNNDGNPAWSPDGRIIAFTGRRQGNDVDLYFVYLQKEEDEADSHDRTVQRAIDKIRKVRLKSSYGDANDPKSAATPAKPVLVSSKDTSRNLPKNPPKVRIDFGGIADRIRRVAVPNMAESGLFWSPDSKRLAFTANIDGKPGTYTVSLPDDLKPKLLASHVGRSARWIERDNRVFWLSGGTPACLATASGDHFLYPFSVPQQVDVAGRFAAAFDLCWRTMRDRYYDSSLGNRNWDNIHRKYAPLARRATDTDELAEVICLMLGELNGSHLNFYPANESVPVDDLRREGGDRPGTPASVRSAGDSRWSETTAHLGVRFDSTHKGPGWKVKDVIAGSPADRVKTKLLPGELVISVNGKAVQPGMDPTSVLNGPPNRDLSLRVRNAQGADREVELRPISYQKARDLLYAQWIDEAQASVAAASCGKLGFLHIRSMDMPSFQQFERNLYAVGVGKDGLIIDVRENGGGSTTDHLLTALTQPVHAITMPRGGEPGYPQDRKVYATWNKPIVVLCNQNSFSNAEIFSHAIKTLKRGSLVGVPTAGGVISTRATEIMDVGRLRVPSRGWFRLADGEDMELNGAVPDYLVWPNPGDMCRGRDEQLEKAVEVLSAEVQEWSRRPQPGFHKASQRETR